MNSKSFSELREFISSHDEIKKFFKDYSNIEEDILLSKAFEIYTKAQKVHSYKCIQTLRFLTPRILNNPYYTKVKENWASNYILDIGCGLGTDLRRMNLDGMTQKYLYGLDIEKDFVQLGFDLFDDEKTNKMTFYIDNILDEQTIEKLQLREKFNIVYSSSVIHLLNKEETKSFLSNVYTVLKTNGIFFGQTTGLAIPQYVSDSYGKIRFIHSKESLQEELEEFSFTDIQVSVQSRIPDIDKKEEKESQRKMMYFYATKRNNS